MFITQLIGYALGRCGINQKHLFAVLSFLSNMMESATKALNRAPNADVKELNPLTLFPQMQVSEVIFTL